MVPVSVWVLSVLACVVVVLTRVRLARSGAGARKVSGRVLDLHTGAGVLAALTWSGHLLQGSLVLGLVALLLWWTTALAGLGLAMRWWPTKGRHVSDEAEDTWARGGWLSLLAHGGVVVAVVAFTAAYGLAAV